MADRVELFVYRCNLTGLLQASIESLDDTDAGPGYRIFGPKFMANSELLHHHVLDKRDAAEIRKYLELAAPSQTWEHVPFVCDVDHDRPGCQFCDGGLFACAVCGAFEGACTTDCAGVRVSASMWERIYAGDLDFRAGRWVDEPSLCTPNGRRRADATAEATAEAKEPTS